MSSNKIDYAKKGWKAIFIGIALYFSLMVLGILLELINEDWKISFRTTSYFYAILAIISFIAARYFLIAALNKKIINFIFFLISSLAIVFFLYATMYSFFYT